MFKENFAVCILVNDQVVKENGDNVKVPFDSNFTIRIKNKLIKPVVCDIYVNGELANQVGPICLSGNSHLDIDSWMLKDKTFEKFKFVSLKSNEVNQKNDSENGLIEVKFYKIKDIEKITEYYIDRYPIYYPFVTWKVNTLLEPKIYHDNFYCGNMPRSSVNCVLSNNTAGFNFIPSDTSNGAIVKGESAKEVNYDTYKKSIEDTLESDPICFKFILIGYAQKVIQCLKCKRIKKYDERFCPSCGGKYIII